MFEAVTAVMGLVSVGVFLAHAFEGVRSRAWARLEARITGLSELVLKAW